MDGAYNYGELTGEGVVVFILDTGVNSAHEDLEGRVLTKHYFSAFDPPNGEDCQGHGSHCAGTVAGAVHGVAKKAEIVSVRVLGCDGSGSGGSSIQGIEHCMKVMKDPSMEGKRGVISMSLGGPGSHAFFFFHCVLFFSSCSSLQQMPIQHCSVMYSIPVAD